MPDLHFTRSANRDLVKILVDIRTHAGVTSAHKYDLEFSRIFDRLRQFPESGAPRPRLGKDVRLCVVVPYLVYYRPSAATDSVLILRILHGHRAITREMLRE